MVSSEKYRVRDYYATNANAIQADCLITSVNTVGERIRWARKERKLSQVKLAEAAGVSQSAIASYEAGHRERPRELVSIARALQASITWLDTGEGDWQAALQQFAQEASQHPPVDLVALGLIPKPILVWEHEDQLPEGAFVFVPRLAVKLGASPPRTSSTAHYVIQ